MIRLAVDVMGYENDVIHAIQACEDFISLHNDVHLTLVGDKNIIESKIKNFNNLTIEHCPEFVTQSDTVLTARLMPKYSMKIAAELLRDNKVDGLLSAGNTSIFVFIMYATIGMLPGINKIGFMPTIPTTKGVFNLIDVGASLDVSADDLAKFAIMAHSYAQQRMSQPKIGVLNIGTEKHKGLPIHKETNAILSKLSNINYIGFVESKELLNHVADVVVTDAFCGNLVLKALEGSMKTLSSLIKQEFKKPWNLLGGLFSYKVFKNIKEKFNYKNHAGAFVLGLNKICVKTHGSADKQQFLSSLDMLYNTVKNNVLDKIKEGIKQYENTL